MVQPTIDERIRVVLLYIDGGRAAEEICAMHGIAPRTFRRWVSAYRIGGIEALKPKKPGPKCGTNSIPPKLECRIIEFKQKNPSWGARRIKYQYDLPCCWSTVHRVIKRHNMLIRIKAKPQPPVKRFQRKHVDSMWQGDSFQFRISSVGKVYVTGFTDDRSRFRVKSRAYLHKRADEAIDALRHALSKGRVPREVYLDNAKQFIAKEFKAELAKHHIRPIYGKPYHPRGRGKIESYHKVLYRELITQVRFTSLSHFRKELRKFDRRYNYWRKSQSLRWKTPAEIYNDRRYFNKKKIRNQP
jgi:transposase InsO family protein